jgi:hypothetical protein
MRITSSAIQVCPGTQSRQLVRDVTRLKIRLSFRHPGNQYLWLIGKSNDSASLIESNERIMARSGLKIQDPPREYS